MHTLENGDFSLCLAPEHGGVLRSLKWRGEDLLRLAGGPVEDPLQSACFALVPFSNRIGGELPSENGRVSLPKEMEGEPYAIHGLAWRRPWLVEYASESTIRLYFTYSGPHWPTAFRSTQTVEIGPDHVSISITLSNTGSIAFPAGIGLHPYFPRGDCRLSIAPEMMWDKDPRGLPFRASPDHPLSGGVAEMAAVRLDHSFSGWDGKADLIWPSRRLGLALDASETLRELVIYSPEDDFFCIEPVSHLTNAALSTNVALQRGWRMLQPGEEIAGRLVLTPRLLS